MIHKILNRFAQNKRFEDTPRVSIRIILSTYAQQMFFVVSPTTVSSAEQRFAKIPIEYDSRNDMNDMQNMTASHKAMKKRGKMKMKFALVRFLSTPDPSPNLHVTAVVLPFYLFSETLNRALFTYKYRIVQSSSFFTRKNAYLF